ncbi:MAG: hypothetical protein WC073_11310 [Sterolibacterium sp.]
MLDNNPNASRLSSLTERALLVKILAELRVQTLILAQDTGFDDDIGELRNTVMIEGDTGLTEL